VFYQISFKYSGFGSLSEQARKEFRIKMEQMVVDMNEESGPSLRCFISTYDKWPFVRFNEIIVGDAKQGVIISLIFAFLVLFVTT